jgi:hypothetical protein
MGRNRWCGGRDSNSFPTSLIQKGTRIMEKRKRNLILS